MAFWHKRPAAGAFNFQDKRQKEKDKSKAAKEYQKIYC
jgi:hypothetical protein